ncbi:MAG: hypothetical protein WAU86_23615 [Oricola sp.]
MTIAMTSKEAAPAPRHDLYYGIHKGIRYAHCRLLTKLGSFDLDSDAALGDVIAAVRNHFLLCRGHLEHEDHEIHAALESRRPGASRVAEEGHEDHANSFVELETLLERLAETPRSGRAAAAHALYRRFALFMADDFVHMNEEETILQPALHEAFDDRELMDIEHRIVTSIPAEEMPLNLAPMFASMHPDERRGMLGDMKTGMPAEAFAGMMEGLVKPNIPANEWDALVDLRA